jgi:tetratricopeptide (TPR) repeat protein
MQAHQEGRSAEAEAIYRSVLERDARHPMALHYLGVIHWQRGELAQAEPLMRQSLDAQPDAPQFHNNLGLVLRDAGRVGEAMESFRRARELDPGYPDAVANLGDTLLRLDDPEGAVRLLDSGTGTYEGLYTLALASEKLDRFGDALLAMRRCRDLVAPKLKAIEAEIDALAREKIALDARVDFAARDRALDETRSALGREIAKRRRVLATNAMFTKPAWRLGTLAFLAGDLEGGWRDFAWRIQRREFEALAGHADGSYELAALPQRLDGALVEIRREQGLGDTLFFLRYANRLHQRGARVRLRGDPRLHGMLARTGIFDELVDEDQPAPGGADFELSAGDLMNALGSPRVDDLPRPLALSALPGSIAQARSVLQAPQGIPTMMVTWRAGTVSDDAGVYFKQVGAFEIGQALSGFPAHVVSVQRNPTAEENEQFARGLGRPFLDLSAWNPDLEGMLALMSLADRYVGVSNTNMHLRAGLGLPATVLVSRPYEWRWPGTGTQSPWYPGFHALREQRETGWAPALARIVQ